MSLNRLHSLLLLLVFFNTNASAITPDELRDLRKQFHGGLSNADSNEAIHDRLQRLLEQEPDNPLLLVYYGSTETMLGKYAWMPWNKLGYVNDGVGHIERALRLAEQQNGSSLNEVQLVAASTYIALPEMFHTFDSGEKLLTRLLELEAGSNWSNDFRYSLFSAAAKAALRSGDNEAEVKWQSLANALAPNTTQGVNQR
jgi:hypothetical protein